MNIKNISLVAIIILACIASAIETDLYVPSFPDMIDALNSSETKIQQILSINFLGIFFSGLICGPLSDRIGQRKVLTIGTGIFTLASLLCYLTPNFTLMLVSRFIQGFGAGSISTVAISIVFNFFEKEKAAQITAILSSICTTMIAVAPIAGTWINIYYGWRSAFLVILVLAAVSWIGFIVCIPKQIVANQDQVNIIQVLHEYKKLLLDHVFLLRTFIRVAMFSCIFVYTANISILFIEHIGVPEKLFGYYQTLTMSSFAIFSFLSAFLMEIFGSKKVKHVGLTLFILGNITLTIVSIVFNTSPILISAAMALLAAGIGLTNAIYFADAIKDFKNKGIAIALTQSLGYFILWGLIDISRIIFDGNIGSINIVILPTAVASCMCVFLLETLLLKKSRC